ncbi:hypothetical protein AWH63_11035 [Marinobacter sp. C18]|uniref:hypothetical protein n=1 Tax=Marinobacter sp. C18 TaxID=1772288 RepID=UPI000948A987|nr:hypothetical protein [Marinobacter sp. C18]OLF82066.1 hypothetical protein AWH63_11035 [Marinobacter sp. C18]
MSKSSNALSRATNEGEAIRQLTLLVRDIEATGGLIKLPNGAHAPAADPDWPDLGDRIFQVYQFLEDAGHREPLSIHEADSSLFE